MALAGHGPAFALLLLVYRQLGNNREVDMAAFSVAHLLQLVVHFDAGPNLPAAGHVPGGVDPVPHPCLGLAVHHLVAIKVVFVP